MPQNIELTGITGTPPYIIQVCDIYGQNCVLLYTLSSTIPPNIPPIPLPSKFDLAPAVVLKIQDANNCITNKIILCDNISSIGF